MARTAAQAPLSHARQHGERLARDEKLEWLARAGLFARGAVFAVIGVLAIKLAFGDGGKTTDQQGALATVARQPFGKVLLVALAIGLAGYALWRLVRAALGHGIETGDEDAKDRVSSVISGIAYAALCLTAIKILAGSGGSGGGPAKATAGVLGWPAGTWLVALAGLVLAGVGIDQARKGVKRDFLETAKTEQMGRQTEQVYTWVGVFGYLARGVVFALMGYFLVRAAIDYDPDKAVGLDGALASLRDAAYGPVLLGIVATGLLGFAAYCMMDSRYRRV